MKASRTSPTQCARCRQDPTIPKRWRCRGCGRRFCAHRIAFKVDGPAACFACLQEAQIDRRDPLARELWTRSALRDVPRPHGQVLHLATDDGKVACGWARRPFAQLTIDPRFVTCTLCRKRAVGGAARPVFSDDERRSLFLYCRNHTVATCCGRSLRLMDLAADFFPVRHEALCPECRGALIDEARAHLQKCADVLTNITTEAKRQRERAQMLVKESRQLRDQIDVNMRKAEAAQAERRRRRAPGPPASDPA